MALVYPQGRISPTKAELLDAWVPTRPWGAPASILGAYRFDDPAGAVGIETFLLGTDDGRVLQVPLTYRAAPLDEGDLVTEMSHSVLGPRWVYDALTDPVGVAAFVAAALTGGHQADVEYDDEDGTRHRRDPQVTVSGSGRRGCDVPALGPLATVSDDHATTVTTGPVELVVARVVPLPSATGGEVLAGTWPGQDTPLVLASVLVG